MGLRRRLLDWVRAPLLSALDAPMKDWLDRALSTRTYARPAEVRALELELAATRKKLDLAMGALQATTQQAADARRESATALALAQQAEQRATSALATAESAATGIADLEASLPRD